MVGKKTAGEKIFTVINYAILIFLSFMMLFPFWEVIKTSFSTASEASSLHYYFWPKKPTWEAYQQVFGNNMIWSGYQNTLIRVVWALLIQMTLTIFTAYALANKKLPNKKFWTIFVMITKFVSGGTVPLYLLVKSLGLFDNVMSLVLPMAINVFYLMIVRNFFMAVPDELEEAACIDGAGVIRVLVSIMLPLSMPIIMTLAMWILVGNWNQWFDCLMYIQTPSKFVLQTVLRKIIIESSQQTMDISAVVIPGQSSSTEAIKGATIIVSSIPIMCIYPFIQKYFVKGMLVGAVKG